MKKYLLFLIIFASLIFIIPTAARGNEPVGERINLLNPPATFSANTAFHVRHGHAVSPSTDYPIGRSDFRLELDGQLLRHSDFILNWVDQSSGNILHRLWVYNFPDGLDLGTHTLIGHWYAACDWAVEAGHYAGPCQTPKELIEIGTQEVEILFD